MVDGVHDWIGIALSDAIEAGTSSGVLIDGREYVVWRDERGGAHVWEDRCPHRGMRLSFGFVRGDYIACLYHGWQYDTEGRCRLIPAHPDLDVPSTIRVRRFQAMERNGIVWARLEEAEANAIDEPAEIDHAQPLRSLYVDAGSGTIRAILLGELLADIDGGAMTASEAGPSSFRLIGPAGTVFLAMQPMNERRTALHIVLFADGDRRDPADRRPWLAWAEALRLRLEALANVPEVG